MAGASLRTLRITFTNNLGRVVGRTIPVVGWLLLAYDVTQIIYRSITKYDAIALPGDRLW